MVLEPRSSRQMLAMVVFDVSLVRCSAVPSLNRSHFISYEAVKKEEPLCISTVPCRVSSAGLASSGAIKEMFLRTF